MTNALTLILGEADYTNFINYTNTEISLYKQEVINGSSSSSTSTSGSNNSGGGSPQKELTPEEEKRQEELTDIQKELEAKFDELFGSIDD